MESMGEIIVANESREVTGINLGADSAGIYGPLEESGMF